MIHPDRNNFSPRVGFAWRPLQKGSLVVRGGYGAYYNTSVYNIIAGNMAQQPPFAQSLSVSGSAANPLSITNGFLAASGDTLTSTYAIDPNYRIGYAQTWTVSVQHDLPLGMFATAGYLGTKGTRLDQQFIPNSVAPGAAVSELPHNFIYETSGGNSIYHAAQFQLNRRFRSGIMANAGYQFSKSIDDAGTGGRGQGNTPVAQNWLDLAAERGLSSFDARHNLNLQFQYSTGMGRSGGTLVNGWKGALMKDWTFGGNVSLRSGNPFTATVGGNRSQVSGTAVSNTLRANATGLPRGGGRIALQYRRLLRSAGRRVGQCRTQYHSRTNYVFVERIAGTHLPVWRAAQRRPAIPGAESAEPRHDYELGHGSGIQPTTAWRRPPPPCARSPSI